MSQDRRIEITGLKRNVESILRKLALPAAQGHVPEVHRLIQQSSGQVEGLIERHRILPQHLSDSARANRGWLAFFADRQNLAGYLSARDQAAAILQAHASSHWAGSMQVEFRPMAGMYRLRRVRGPGSVSRVQLATPFVTFEADDFTELAKLMFQRDAKARRGVHERMLGEAYQQVQAELAALGGLVEQTAGAAHDLAESFARVNARYFAGAMPRPRLTWSAAFTHRKFGHYDYVRDTVLLSRTLDQPGVETFVVDFVLFHELLHKKHGLRWGGGRSYAHTAAFSREERTFERYAEAGRTLQALARGRR